MRIEPQIESPCHLLIGGFFFMEGFIGYSECGFSWGRKEMSCKREMNTHFSNNLLSNGTLQSFYIISEYFILFLYLNDPVWSCKKVGYKELKIVNLDAFWMYVVISKIRIHYYTSWSVVGVMLYFLLSFWNEKKKWSRDHGGYRL